MPIAPDLAATVPHLHHRCPGRPGGQSGRGVAPPAPPLLGLRLGSAARPSGPFLVGDPVSQAAVQDPHQATPRAREHLVVGRATGPVRGKDPWSGTVAATSAQSSTRVRRKDRDEQTPPSGPRSSPGAVSGPRRSCCASRNRVISTRVGYAGGANDTPTADDHAGLRRGGSGHLSIPERTSYRTSFDFLLPVHRPRPWPRACQTREYRSEIFCPSDEQRRQVAEGTIGDADASGLWPGKVVTRWARLAPSGRPRRKTRTTSRTTPTARISSDRSRPLRESRCA